MKRRGGRGNVLTQERREKGSGVDEITDGASLPGQEGCNDVWGAASGMRRGSILLAEGLGRARPTSRERARGDGGGDPSLPRGPVVRVGLAFLSDPYLVPGLGPGCGARHSREAAGLELGPTRRHGVSWPGMARAREVGVGGRKAERAEAGEGEGPGKEGGPALQCWRTGGTGAA